MHTAARKNQIGGGVEEAVHPLCSSIQVALASAASGPQRSFYCSAPRVTMSSDVLWRPDSIRSERVDPAIESPFIEIPGIKPVATGDSFVASGLIPRSPIRRASLPAAIPGVKPVSTAARRQGGEPMENCLPSALTPSRRGSRSHCGGDFK